MYINKLVGNNNLVLKNIYGGIIMENKNQNNTSRNAAQTTSSKNVTTRNAQDYTKNAQNTSRNVSSNATTSNDFKNTSGNK